MAYMAAAPEMLRAAATDLATIGSNVSAAHMVAAARTTSLTPAAADEVSAGIAQLFSVHAQDYQALAGKAAALHGDFVQNLSAGASSYASTEAGLASLLQDLTADEASIGSAVGALQGQLFNDFLALVGRQTALIPVLVFAVLLDFAVRWLLWHYFPNFFPDPFLSLDFSALRGQNLFGSPI